MIQFAQELLPKRRSDKATISMVFIDNIDVTNVCFAFDPEAGIANLYEWKGYPNIPSSEFIFSIRDGRVPVRLVSGEITIRYLAASGEFFQSVYPSKRGHARLAW